MKKAPKQPVIENKATEIVYMFGINFNYIIIITAFALVTSLIGMLTIVQNWEM